ncbi:MAG: cytidine deaminase [Gemmatimonadota bacterium]|nr:cytidine deaminase [Gemmatimonadota bacterium]
MIRVDPDTVLREAALDAMQRAYAPYSGFRVGAALLGADGRIFVGCNVENVAYGEAICAERAAVLAAVVAGVRDFTRIAIATEADHAAPPCGACRQVLAEFAPALPVMSYTLGGDSRHWTIADLLPFPFTPNYLDEVAAHHTAEHRAHLPPPLPADRA